MREVYINVHCHTFKNIRFGEFKYPQIQFNIFPHCVKLEEQLEYKITFLSFKKTGRKPCSIRKHIIGIVMVSERDLTDVIFMISK